MTNQEESLKALERCLDEFFAPQTSNARKREIESILSNFTQMSDAWSMCLYFMNKTKNEYVFMFCLNTIENVINQKWLSLEAKQKLLISTSLSQSMMLQHTSFPPYIRNKLAKLIVDIGKNDWPHFYPDFFSSILQIAQQPDNALLGVILLQTTSEELAAPRDDLSMARKDELRSLLLQQIPAVFNILNNILEAMLEKHRHLVAATPPPSPTSGESSAKSLRHNSNQLFSSSPITNANFVSLLLGSPSRAPQIEALPPLDPASLQLCWACLTCLAHYLAWVPLSTVIRPQLLSTIFHYAAFGCQSRSDLSSSPGSRNSFSSNTHKLGVLAMNCINEILSKNCVPQEFEDFLLQMFQQTFSLLQKMTKESNTNSSGNKLEELDEIYVEKFTDFLRLFVSVHLRRFEANAVFPVLEFLSLLFKYTFRQPTNEGYYSCLDIWITFLDYLSNKTENRTSSKNDILEKYKGALMSLTSSILQKIQFRYNQSQLEELDDDTLDDDSETEWQHFLRQNLEVIAKIAELLTAEAFQLIWDPFQEHIEAYFGIEKFVDDSGFDRTLCVAAENDCRRLHCALRDLSSLLQALGRLAMHFIGEHFSSRFVNATQIITRLVQVVSYGSKNKLFEVKTSASVLQQDFVEVQAQSLAAVKAYTHWMSQFYSETLRSDQHKTDFYNIISTIMEALTPLINKQIPDKIIQSAAHLMLSITNTIRPAFLLQLSPVRILYESAGQGACQNLSQEVQLLVYRSLSHYLLLPWPGIPESDQDWSSRAANHKALTYQLTSQFIALTSISDLATSKHAQDQAKPVIKKTMIVCQDWVESLVGEVSKSKNVCNDSLQSITQTTLQIFPIYIHQTDVVEQIMTFFLSLFQSLRVQMGVSFTEKIIHTFMNVFSRDLLAETISQETSGAFRVIENFLKILELIAQEPGSQFKAFLPRIISVAMDQIYPIVAPRQSPDMKSVLYHLLHEILINNWRFFFKSTVLDMMKDCGDGLENSEFFLSILQAYGQSFLQTDITIFRQNLESLEKLHSKWKLYSKKIFQEVMCQQFLKVLFQVLIQKSHDLLQEEIVISIYHMASVDFDSFFTKFLPHYLTTSEGLDANQRQMLVKNFKTDKDLPSFTQTVQRFVNDSRYYLLINSSLPAGSVKLS